MKRDCHSIYMTLLNNAICLNVRRNEKIHVLILNKHVVYCLPNYNTYAINIYNINITNNKLY